MSIISSLRIAFSPSNNIIIVGRAAIAQHPILHFFSFITLNSLLCHTNALYGYGCARCSCAVCVPCLHRSLSPSSYLNSEELLLNRKLFQHNKSRSVSSIFQLLQLHTHLLRLMLHCSGVDDDDDDSALCSITKST